MILVEKVVLIEFFATYRNRVITFMAKSAMFFQLGFSFIIGIIVMNVVNSSMRSFCVSVRRR